MRRFATPVLLSSALWLYGCAPIAHAPLTLPQKSESGTTKLTLGLAQQTLKKGASRDDVVSALGSPNMVTSNSAGEETWIYDKVSTEIQAEQSSASLGLAGGAGAGTSNALGAVGAAFGSSSGAVAVVRSQKTLTLIVKFKNDKVDSYQTRATSF